MSRRFVLDHRGKIQVGGQESGQPWVDAVCSVDGDSVRWMVGESEVLTISDASAVTQTETPEILKAATDDGEPFFWLPVNQAAFMTDLKGDAMSTSDRVALAAAAAPTQPAADHQPVEKSFPKARPWLFVTAALLIVGSFLPWAQAGIFSFAGTRGDGVLTLIGGVIVGALGFIKPTSAIPGAVALLISLGSLWVVGNVFTNFADTPENIGMGLLVVGLGGLIGVFAGVKLIDDRKH